MDDEEADLREQIFHNNVREQIIFLLIFILLFLLSFMLIEKFRRRDSEDYLTGDEDEVKVYRISLWLCTFALAVSLGSALLLPVSIVSNEVLLLYPNSYYVKWLNSSLIQGLWNHVFLFSNLSMFVFLPFAYLFSESSGFTGHRGLKGRVYETFLVLALLGVLMLGLAYVVSAWLEGDRSSIDALLNLWTYLPFLYSCVSFVGVLMLLVFTPLGFVRLFGVVGGVLVKPQFLRDLNEEYYMYSFEEDTIRRRMQNALSTGSGYISPEPMYPDRGDISAPLDADVSMSKDSQLSMTRGKETPLLRLRNGALQAGLKERLQRVVSMKKKRKTDEVFGSMLEQLHMESNLHRKTICVRFLKETILLHKVNCVNKKLLKVVLLENVHICCNDAVADILLVDVLECLQAWITHCWCVWQLSTDHRMLSALIKLLYVSRKESIATVIQDLIVSLVTLCTKDEQKTIYKNLEKSEIKSPEFKEMLEEIKSETLKLYA